MKMIRTLEEQLNNAETGEITMEAYSFDIFGSKLYVIMESNLYQYVDEYIETVRQGKPDKLIVIKKYIIDNEIMDEEKYENFLKIYPDVLMSHGPAYRLTTHLTLIEKNLKPILDTISRDNKIDDILG